MTYLLGTIALLAAGAIAIQALESHRSACDFSTAATASLATICTVGPGLNQVGAINNYGWFSDPSKLVLCLLMLIGRLEVFVILVLLSPRFWRSH